MILRAEDFRGPLGTGPESNEESKGGDNGCEGAEYTREAGRIKSSRHPGSAQGFRSRRLIDLVLKKRNLEGEFDVVICARQAELGFVAADRLEAWDNKAVGGPAPVVNAVTPCRCTLQCCNHPIRPALRALYAILQRCNDQQRPPTVPFSRQVSTRLASSSAGARS
jgi:hypothetical protein